MFIHLETEFIVNELPPALLVDAEGNPLELTDAAMVTAGWYRFAIEPEPVITTGQRLTYTRPTNGADCTQVWAVVDMTPAEAATATPVPQVVTMRQARLALLAGGMLPGVAAAIASMPSPQKEAAVIEWEYSQTVERSRPFVLLLGQALGLEDAALDDLFILAATL